MLLTFDVTIDELPLRVGAQSHVKTESIPKWIGGVGGGGGGAHASHAR
jgi:hypothetical protein